jgi:hypothetical protein
VTRRAPLAEGRLCTNRPGPDKQGPPDEAERRFVGRDSAGRAGAVRPWSPAFSTPLGRTRRHERRGKQANTPLPTAVTRRAPLLRSGMLTRSLPLISPFGLPWQSPERLPSPPGCPPGPNCRLPPIHERAIAQVLSEPHRRLCTNRPSPDHQLPTDKAPCLPMILSSHPSSVLGRPAAFPMILSSMILSSHNPARNAPSSKKNHFAVNDFAPSAPFFISPPPSVLRPRPPRGLPHDSVVHDSVVP